MIRNAGPSSDSGRARAALAWALAGLAILVAAVCVPRTPVWPQEEEDIGGTIEKYRGLLALASQKLEDLELPEALARFTEVIDGYKTGKMPTTTPLTRQIVGQAYEGRARTYANLGRNAEAEADFEALIRFDVNWPVDRTRTSPKIVALYDKARKQIVGTLSVKSEPPGAMVSLNGDPIGRSPLFEREQPAGPYQLRIEADGFDPVEEKIVIAGGARLERSVRLKPNARDLLVSTSPTGAKVSLDGKERGTTFGTAGPEYAEVAAHLEVGLTDISAPLQVGHVSPGSHLLKIEKECHEPQLLSITVNVDPNDLSPVRYEPIKLTQSLGGLALDSTPSGAEALLDGRSIGRTPVRLDGICAGRHEVRMRAPGVGQWIGSTDVVKGQRATINERLRATLAYVGMTVSGPAGKAPAGEQELADLLSQLRSYNVVGPGAGLSDALLARKQPAADGDLSAEYVASVAAATGADLILAAKPGEGAFGQSVEITLMATSPSFAALRDRIRVPLDDKAQTKDLLTRLDVPLSLSAPWIGLETIEVARAAHPIVIRVQPNGPASKAGVSLGDAVVSLGGRAIANPRDLTAALAGLRAGAQASLSLQSQSGLSRQVNVVIGSTPIMLAPDSPGALNARWASEMSFRARMEAALGHPKSDERTAALLSLAVLLMKQGLFEAALKEGLDTADLPTGAGLSSGTASYLKALCLRKLNRVPEARQQLTAAASQPDATLWSLDGPPVAERARRLLKAL